MKMIYHENFPYLCIIFHWASFNPGGVFADIQWPCMQMLAESLGGLAERSGDPQMKVFFYCYTWNMGCRCCSDLTFKNNSIHADPWVPQVPHGSTSFILCYVVLVDLKDSFEFTLNNHLFPCCFFRNITFSSLRWLICWDYWDDTSGVTLHDSIFWFPELVCLWNFNGGVWRLWTSEPLQKSHLPCPVNSIHYHNDQQAGTA